MVTVIGELAVLALPFLLAPIIWAGRAFANKHSDIRWRLACWRADYRYAKLRAGLLLRRDDVPTALGSPAPSGEPQPASSLHSGAGTNLQPDTGRLDQGRRRDPSSESPQPAPERVVSGAGPTPPRTGLAAGHEEHRDADTHPAGIPVSASPHQRSAAAVTPDSAAADLPTRSSVSADEQVRGVA